MKIEDQVCSLELAKRLKELGVKQDSLFYWHNISIYPMVIYGDSTEWSGDRLISAFTSSELSKMLPNYVSTKESEPFNGYRIYLEKFISVDKGSQINNWIVNYHCDTVEGYGKNEFFVRRLTSNIYDPSLSNAMAKMIIYLLERGLWEDKKIFVPPNAYDLIFGENNDK